MFRRARDFEKSFYKFIQDNYTAHPVFYGDIAVDADANDIWLYCNFSELNVGTGYFSYAYIDAITRVQSVDVYNNQLATIVDELRELFRMPDVGLYDFTYSEAPQEIIGAKIVVQDSGRPIFERIEELEFGENRLLLQASQMTVRLKLLEDFARNRT
jgi:hypothetical protein